ncbi:Podosporapepsin [Beauveria bassiana D1-5]|uniref:Podosporapepsin n=1 Tax=Beauveria bassiana D1-5 TaxID=1245745 RepID=A0A0A2VZ01_BEABA|nr:Podosporapepsin [Beauveria bassiana D1-5]
MKTTAFVAVLSLAATGHSATQWTAASKLHGADDRTFSLQQIHNENFKGVNPTDALLRVYARYAKFIPDQVKAIIEAQPALKARYQSLDAEDPSMVFAEALPAPADSEYVLPVGLGTPPQILPLNLDTGSSDFWVFSDETPKDGLQATRLYYPKNSNTSRLLPGQSWRVKYGDGSAANGTVYVDRAAIGPLGYDRQAIQVATGISKEIARDGFISGILGMASSNANTVTPTKQLTLLDNIKDSLARPIFTANLKKGLPGNYNFGYINQSEYTGDIAYTPIDQAKPYWQIKLSGYQLGQDPFQPQEISGIVDTGTTLTMVPKNIIDDYYSKLPGSYFDEKSGNMMFPCELPLPDFVFGIGENYRGRVPGHYINYARHTDKFCYGGLQSSDNLPFAVFGDILLKAQFVVFDRGNMTVGFANKETVPPPPS